MSIIDRLNSALHDRYRVERELGEGGMARVYLAEDLKHDRAVALKVLKPELAADVDAERFLSEIRTTANLQHPHILPLFDSGEADGLLYYVMPFVRGESLRAKLEREGSLDAGEAVRIAASIADALESAHRHGILHRDIKPANVMMSDGEPLLADFGIALALERDAPDRLTRTGSSIGTPGYMSPEQAAGDREIDTRSDIYSLAALTYEMLTGRAPFADLSPVAAMAKVLTEDPPPPSDLDPSIPGPVSVQVIRSLARDRGQRHDSAAAFAHDLRAASSTRSGPERPRKALWLSAGVPALAVALLVGWLWLRSSREARWARVEAVPEIQRLLESGEAAAAYALAGRAREVLPDDPVLGNLYDAATVQVGFTSEPAGAEVSFRPYDVEDTVWTRLGTTPIDSVDVPDEELLVRFELDGHATHHVSLSPVQGAATVVLSRDEADDVVEIAPATQSLTQTPVEVDRFWIDRTEVTNAEYQDFVDAILSGELEDWTAALAERDVAVDRERLRTEAVDRTGRPGPAGWELSRFREGRGSYPVQGVSWFEAVAYCAFRGKEVPTYHHWKVADGGSRSPWDGLLRHANVGGGDGPLPVGSAEAFSVHGVSDMAGNVREWVWNAAGDDRYVLGGSWESPEHLYVGFDATDPWSRSMENGVRCARYEGPIGPTLLEPIELPIFDFTGYEPVDDETFAGYRAFYDYDRGPLNVTRRPVAESETWTREYVEIDAAYLDERVPIHLFLPNDAEPPYQSVVYLPGSAAFSLSSSEHISEMSELMFLPESGRALLYPVVSGTYERQHERPSRGDAELRQRYVWLVQDVMRTVDFVVEDEELADDAIAYMGLSFGAELVLPYAVEKRFATTVLIGAALDPGWRGMPEAVAPWNFISRVTTPSLVINGRYDFMHPYEESQLPFFRMIDVPDQDKRFVVLDAGHVPPNNEVIAHTLEWLDQRLGPVRRTSRRGR